MKKAKEKLIRLAPPEPPTFNCPECEAESERKTKLRFLRSLSECWGTIVTRHDVYRCRLCGQKFVSTNGREPEVAADWI